MEKISESLTELGGNQSGFTQEFSNRKFETPSNGVLGRPGGGMVEADILFYYLSLVYVKTDEVYDKWYPGLCIYNSNFTILPKLASSRYFEKAKILFGVDDKEGLITLIQGLKDNLQRHIPSVQQGFGLDKVCSFR